MTKNAAHPEEARQHASPNRRARRGRARASCPASAIRARAAASRPRRRGEARRTRAGSLCRRRACSAPCRPSRLRRRPLRRSAPFVPPRGRFARGRRRRQALPCQRRDSVVASLTGSPRGRQHGHREDRAAAADGIEQEPDREPEGQGEERPAHCSSRVRTSRREGCGRASAGAPRRGGRARGARSASAPAGSASRRAGRRCQG